MSKLLQLFIAFLEIGAVAFGGGYASLPLIQDVIVNQKGWLSMMEMTDVVTISQLTPGPIAINAASFVGTKIAGVPGAIVASLGVIVPQSILMIFLGRLIFKGKKIVYLDRMLEALRPGVVGLIATASLSMIITAIFPEGWGLNLDYIGLVGFVVGLILYWKKMDLIKLILLGAVIGLGLSFIDYFIL